MHLVSPKGTHTPLHRSRSRPPVFHEILFNHLLKKNSKHLLFSCVSPVCFKANVSEAGSWCKKGPFRKEEVVGEGINYSSVFKTGLEEKEGKRASQGLLISPPLEESFSPASSGPTQTVFITRGASPLSPERRCCLQPSVVGHSSAGGHRRTYRRSNWWDSFRLCGWRAGV